MKSFFIFLSRNKLYTFINVFGLSVSLMFVILIANYTVRQFTTDNFHQKRDRIYVLCSEDRLGTAYRIGDRLAGRYPEIEKICCATPVGTREIIANQTKYEARAFCVDTTFFDVFTFKLLEGDPSQALASKESVILSRSFAGRLFGTQDPMGKTIRFPLGEGDKERTVTGIMEDIDNSVFPEYDIVMRAENMGDYNEGMVSEALSNAGSAYVFILEKEGADVRAKAEDMKNYFSEFFWIYQNNVVHEVVLIPMKDLYFSPQIQQSWDLNKGNKSFVIILLTVGIIILIFAVINYLNLTVAQTGFRAKEMATRRLLGSTRGELFRRMIFESTLLCFIAFLIGLMLAAAVEPWANRLLESKISVTGDLDWAFAAAYAALVLLLGAISGAVPAMVISGFKPIDVVRGTFRHVSKMVYGKILIVFQNVITIVLVACSLGIILQIRHLLNAPLGYETENILDIEVNHFSTYSQIATFRNEVRQLPFVEEVAFGRGTPFSGGNNLTISFGKERMISFQVFEGDSLFFKIFGLKPKRDNHIKNTPAYTSGRRVSYFNEAAFRAMDIREDAPEVKMGKNYERSVVIAGVYPDFHIRSILVPQSAAIIINLENFDNAVEGGYWPWDVIVKIAEGTDLGEAYKKIEQIYVRLTEGSAFSAGYMKDQISENFAEQRRTAYIMMIFTVIALLISTLGMLAMSTYYIQQRSQEVALRKVFGSTSREVLGRLIGNFLKLVLIAFVIAVPIGWYVLNWWLEDYSYRIAVSPLIFVAAGAFSLLVALITVFWQSRRAADMNPVDAIKR